MASEPRIQSHEDDLAAELTQLRRERDKWRERAKEFMEAWERAASLLDELSMKPYRAEEIVARWQKDVEGG